MSNPYVNKVVVNGQIKLDLTGDTVTAESLVQGYSAHDSSGASIIGVADVLSKCSIIVHIDTGSTVGAYSDAEATTLVKAGKEIGTSGYYFITGLNTGKYYIKAVKGSNTVISNAIIFFADGVEEIEMFYRVPSTYQAVEYLESTGTQCINTGYNPSASSGFEIDYVSKSSIMTIDAEGFGSLFGSRTASKANEFQMTTYSVGTTGGTVRLGSNTEYDAYIEKNVRQYAKYQNGVYTAPNGNTYNYAFGTMSNPRPVYLFALNNANSRTQESKTKIYRFKLFTGTTLERDFVPCYRKSDSVAGMWDRVHEQFYTNIGTGTFIIGGNI